MLSPKKSLGLALAILVAGVSPAFAQLGTGTSPGVIVGGVILPNPKKPFKAAIAKQQPMGFRTTHIPENFVGQGRNQVVAEGNTNPFAGLSINQYLGANAFYDAGYTGSSAIVANIEGGHAWNTHETLGHVTTFINGPGTVAATSIAAATTGHATATAGVIGGRPISNEEHQRGIAYNATLWSGSLATEFTGGNTFDYSLGSFFQPYVTAALTGVGGETADVINSSWGLYGGPGHNLISTGYATEARLMDALAYETKKVFVFAAGNNGADGPDTIHAPATSYNVIAVGALTGHTDPTPYDTVAGFSSRGPSKAIYVDGVGDVYAVPDARARIDITAPGTSLVLANYNSGSPNPAGYGVGDGTSFAAPIVAAGAALLVDAGRAEGAANSADGRVVKAILLNSADKTVGWTNNSFMDNGVHTTEWALDVNSGAGRMNLAAALPYLTSPTATRDVAGTDSGDLGAVSRLGYDFGMVNNGGFNSYTIDETFEEGVSLTITLNWFVERSTDSFTNPTFGFEDKFADLDLEVWRIVDGEFDTLVAQSMTWLNNTEHIHLTDLEAGEYGFRVVYFGDTWNFTGVFTEMYAVAWSFTPVPEPAGILFALVMPGLAIVLRRRRRANQGTEPAASAV